MDRAMTYIGKKYEFIIFERRLINKTDEYHDVSIRELWRYKRKPRRLYNTCMANGESRGTAKITAIKFLRKTALENRNMKLHLKTCKEAVELWCEK